MIPNTICTICSSSETQLTKTGQCIWYGKTDKICHKCYCRKYAQDHKAVIKNSKVHRILNRQEQNLCVSSRGNIYLKMSKPYQISKESFSPETLAFIEEQKKRTLEDAN